MILRINVAEASLLKELATDEINRCVDFVRLKRASATGNPYDRSEHVANLYESRVSTLIDFLGELSEAYNL